MIIALIPLCGLCLRCSLFSFLPFGQRLRLLHWKLTHEFSVIDTILGAYGELGAERYTPLIEDEELPCSHEVKLAPCPLFIWVVASVHTTTLLRCDRVTNGPGRCGGGGKEALPFSSVRAGKLGEERVGLIDDGGVMELWEEVSIVEEDLPTISTFVAADFGSE